MRRVLPYLVLGQLLDASTFVLFFMLIPPGFPLTERNPLTVFILATGGLAGVWLAKVGIATVVWLRGRRRAMSLRWPYLTNGLLLVATVSGFIGATFNTYAIWQVVR